MKFPLPGFFFGEPPRKSTDPICGKCGYCVRGIPSLICPECGSDLREVGIIPPGGSGVIRLSRVALWTILFPVAAVLLSILMLNTILPYAQKEKVERTIVCQAPYLSLTIQFYGDQLLWQPRALPDHNPIFPESGYLYDGQYGQLNLNFRTRAYSYLDRAHGVFIDQPSGFGSLAIARWLAGAGINGGDPRVLDLCNAVFQSITEIPQGTAGKSTPLKDQNGLQIGVARPAATWIVHDEPSPVLIGVLVIFWIGVWIYGFGRLKRPGSKKASQS
jgi:hypothetical protein